jgi:hypothetical protein
MTFDKITDHIENLFRYKVKWNDLDDKSKKTVGIYMLFKFLSMNIDYIDLVNELQYLQSTLSKDQIYDLLIDMLPKQKYFGYTYITSKKIDNKLVLSYFVDYFECNVKEAEMYIDTLIKTKQTHIIKELISYYECDKIIVDKILKQLNINK